MIDNLARAAAQQIAASIEKACAEAKSRGPDWRLAIGEARLEQTPAMTWQTITDMQFLRPGTGPALPGACTIYGPWNDGWTPHDGGPEPQFLEVTVDAQGSDGETVFGWYPHNLDWSHVRWWRNAE